MGAVVVQMGRHVALIDRNDVMHAVEAKHLFRSFQSVCGLAAPSRVFHGYDDDPMIAEWPSPAQIDEFVRCRTCYEMTGRPPVAPIWRESQ